MKAASRARISRAALSDLLADIVKSQFGPERRISRWSRRMSAYSSSCRIVNLRVCLDNGEACSLVWKSLETESWLPGFAALRPWRKRRRMQKPSIGIISSNAGRHGELPSSTLIRMWSSADSSGISEFTGGDSGEDRPAKAGSHLRSCGRGDCLCTSARKKALAPMQFA